MIKGTIRLSVSQSNHACGYRFARNTVVLSVLAFFPIIPSFAQDKTSESPAIDLVPTQITASALSSEEPVEMQVHLKAGAQPLSAINVSIFSNDGIRPSDPKALVPLKSLAANSEYSWSLQLVRPGGLISQAKVHVRVEFDMGGNAPVHRYLYSAADLTPRAAATGAAPVSADFMGSTITLAHERPAQVFLRLTNQYQQALQITSLHAYKPQFVGVSRNVSDATAGEEAVDVALAADNLGAIESGQAKIIPLILNASSEVVPGTYTLLVSSSLQGKDGSVYSVTASREFQVIVLGESDILQKLSVPSLLFLPGALFIITWSMLWGVGKTEAERNEFPFKPTNTDFWVIAIALSLFAAVIYPGMTRFVLGQRRDYLVAYGFRDFAYVFAFAIVGAVIAFGGRQLWRHYLAYRHRRADQMQQAELAKLTPQATDAADEILDKLATAKAPAELRQVHPVSGTDAASVLVLEPWSTATQLWIAPPAQLVLVAPDTNYEALDAYDNILTGQVTKAEELAHLVRKGLGQNWWTLQWQGVGTIAGPTPVQASAWTDSAQRARLVR